MPLIDTHPDALASVYARGLLDLAEAKGGRSTIEAVQSELEDILEMARGDAKFNEFLASRVVATKDRAESLKRIFEGQVNDLTLRFLLVLNRKGRLSHLVPIVGAYDALVQERFGRIEVDVLTAAPMSQDEVRHARDRLSNVLGKEVVVHPYTDSTMIGGVKFRIGDQLVDASLATRLRKLKDRLNSSGMSDVRSKIERIVEG
ncbi:MAG: ATP synthase F1 subunit delta [Phycisphaerales bacterium]|nr:ATP synthase F1 subunit delta [Phycisphaerales bacterium]